MVKYYTEIINKAFKGTIIDIKSGYFEWVFYINNMMKR